MMVITILLLLFLLAVLVNVFMNQSTASEKFFG